MSPRKVGSLNCLARKFEGTSRPIEAAPAYKKLVKEYYSFAEVPQNSIVRKYSNDIKERDPFLSH